GDEIRSVKTVAQNNEMRAKIIGYNAARIVDMASSLFGGFLQSRAVKNELRKCSTNSCGI
ncbi:MAG: hypothetical protein QXP63_03010, partial [Conexivisphaerales archaeon]